MNSQHDEHVKAWQNHEIVAWMNGVPPGTTVYVDPNRFYNFTVRRGGGPVTIRIKKGDQND